MDGLDRLKQQMENKNQNSKQNSIQTIGRNLPLLTNNGKNRERTFPMIYLDWPIDIE